MRIGIATDHGGFELKSELAQRLRDAGHDVVDFGAHDYQAEDDYPDYGIPLAESVSRGDVQRGIAICGSGVGICITANKVPGVRACLVHDLFSARQGVADDDMNVLCLGGRTTKIDAAWELVSAFLSTEFSHLERHVRRVNKVKQLEVRQ